MNVQLLNVGHHRVPPSSDPDGVVRGEGWALSPRSDRDYQCEMIMATSSSPAL